MSRSETTATDTLPETIKLWAASRWSQRLRIMTSRRSLVPVWLVAILLVAAIFRFTGINWDYNKHLHPDERFLTSVAADIDWPEKFDTYFDPQASPLSPYSLENMGLYVYGTLPLYLVKGVAVVLDQNNYDAIAIVGRTISGLFDLAAIFFLFLLGRRLYDDSVALLGAALLSLSVLNIQLSHFFTVDTFANLFVVMVMYFAVRVCERGRWWDYALIGLALGAGMASKISVLTLGVPILLAAGWDFLRRMRSRTEPVTLLIERTCIRLGTLILLTLLLFRLLQPIAFQGPDFWNFSLNPAWKEDIEEQQKIVNGEIDAPPWHQWTNRPALIFPLQNILLWGLGLPLGIAAWAGWAFGLYELFWRRKWNHLLLVAYVGVAFLYHGLVWVKFMRYFLPIYPFLALLAAYLLVWLWRSISAWALRRQEAMSEREAATDDIYAARTQAPVLPSQTRYLWLAALPTLIVLVGTLFWAMAFTSIYTREHPRIAATRWFYANVPTGTVLANEHWDDSLPLGLDGFDAFGPEGYRNVEMPNYEDDTPEKLNRMLDSMSQAEYIVLSSNRLYDSIPRLPMRYPMTVRYYELLFSGQLGFTRVEEFTSYPQFLGLQFPDQSAEEAFSVYDHPRVQIFKKQPDFNQENVRALLSAGVNWDSVARLTPRQATAAPDMLQLSLVDRATYSATTARLSPAPWAGFASQVPVVTWALVLGLLGLIALPLVLVALGRLSDGGYIFSKLVGLLLAAWGSWLLASWRALPFTWWSSLIVIALIAVCSGIVAYYKRAELGTLLRTSGRRMLIQEALFWVFFAAMLSIRWRNPDLWHNGLGGEKPMDTAYLTAITNTPFFPSYDPWYAGGYINYYYFGFVLVATLNHLSGVVPTTAYNLAVPTFFAMTALGAFSVASNLIPSRRAADAAIKPVPSNSYLRSFVIGNNGWLGVGLFGALFVTVIGNLGQIQLLWTGLQELSNIAIPEKPSPLLPLARAFDGLIELLFNNRTLNFRPEWWYWNATRVFPPAPDEAGAITEFPFFTFLFADLHAHMMSMPLTLLALAVCVNLLRFQNRAALPALEAPASEAPVLPAPEGESTTEASEQPIPESPPARPAFTAWVWQRVQAFGLSEALLLMLGALTIGALWPTNTWDFPTYAVLIGAALACRAYVEYGAVNVHAIVSVAWRWGVLLVIGFLLFLPFHQHSASAYFGAEQWKGSRTPLWAYLIVHGFFLFILVSYLLNELAHGRGHNSIARLIGLGIRHRQRIGRLARLHAVLVKPSPWYELVLRLAGFVGLVLLGLALFGHAPEALALALTILAAILIFSPKPAPRRQFSLCLIALGLLLTAVVEVVVLKGDISRMNTVFKFYLQVWVMWGVASAAVLPVLAERFGRLPQPKTEAPQQRQSAAGGSWWRAFALLFAACLLYTVTATPGRIKDRFENVSVQTLDGTAYMRTAVYPDQDQRIELEWDRQAIDWLKANTTGQPAIVEAATPLYRWGARVSIYTGLPTIIGWDWHQKQQRSILPGEWIDKRLIDVRAIYADPNPAEAQRLLRLYNVEYIYLGKLEQLYYPGDGLLKFEEQNGQLWDKVYENQEVKIYKVR